MKSTFQWLSHSAASSGVKSPEPYFPVRFIWQMNADGYFTQGVENFVQIVGSKADYVVGHTWFEIAAKLKIDAKGEIARSMAARETWCGIITHWPLNGTNESLLIEMSGLPVYDLNREFAGYRGFCICRDRKRFNAIQRQAKPAAEEKPAGKKNDSELPPQNSESPRPLLTASDHNAFDALARELIERLKNSNDKTRKSKFIDVTAEDMQPPALGEQTELVPLQLRQENHELKAILDTAADGVLLLDNTGRILSANRSAQALFNYNMADFEKLTFADLFAPESRQFALDRLHGFTDGTLVLDAGHEVIGLVHQGGLVPLYITMGKIEGSEKLCAILRDMTVWKRTEEELINARKQAERASKAKSEFIAKISHEIRTPLNAIIGFSEMMMEERFGSAGSDRRGHYINNIYTSGRHLMALLNDLLDISRIEAGKLQLTFTNVDLKLLLQECVAIMQDQANRERVIIRTSLPDRLPPIVADARSVRQIVLNLLSNSIKFTEAGGQVIASIVLSENNEVILRIRDTGAGMSAEDLQIALEPFGQLSGSAGGYLTGTGLGLPITKALAQANDARLRISSQINEGTLVEITFSANG